MSAGCKSGVQTHSSTLGAWMKFGWWQRGDQLRTCKLSASLGNPTTQGPAGNKGENSSDSGCDALSSSPQTSFKTLCRALTLHLPLSLQLAASGAQPGNKGAWFKVASYFKSLHWQ